jgi:hypothetical protein
MGGLSQDGPDAVYLVGAADASSLPHVPVASSPVPTDGSLLMDGEVGEPAFAPRSPNENDIPHSRRRGRGSDRVQ